MPYTKQNYRDVEYVSWSSNGWYASHTFGEREMFISLGVGVVLGYSVIRYRVVTRDGWRRVVVMLLNGGGRTAGLYDFNDTECSSQTDNIIREEKHEASSA